MAISGYNAAVRPSILGTSAHGYPAADLAGNLRPSGGVDIGAYDIYRNNTGPTLGCMRYVPSILHILEVQNATG